MGKFSKRSEQYLAEVQAELRELMQQAVAVSRVAFEITEGRRTVARQQQLYLQGKSQLDGITTIGKHQQGRAVDIVCHDPKTHRITYEHKYYYYVAGLLQQLAHHLDYQLIWGGWWSFEDCCHFELA